MKVVFVLEAAWWSWWDHSEGRAAVCVYFTSWFCLFCRHRRGQEGVSFVFCPLYGYVRVWVSVCARQREKEGRWLGQRAQQTTVDRWRVLTVEEPGVSSLFSVTVSLCVCVCTIFVFLYSLYIDWVGQWAPQGPHASPLLPLAGIMWL